MLGSFSDLKRMSVAASDGPVGRVKDAYFDDRRWALRYLVVHTGNWLIGHDVLVAPGSLHLDGRGERLLELGMTSEQVRRSPGIDADRPVSRQYEASTFDGYDSRHYLTGPVTRRLDRAHRRRDPHLRSAGEVCGHHVNAADGPIGHVEDFLLDDERGSFPFVVVDTRNWLPGRRVLIDTQLVRDIDWLERRLDVSLSRDEVLSAEEYRGAALR
jgi:hypothetical protein